MNSEALLKSIGTLLIAVCLVAWGAGSAFGQDYVYAARVSSTDTNVWDAPFYWISAGGTAYATSTGRSGATDPVSTPARAGSYYHTASTMHVGEGYGLVHVNGTAPGAVYEVEVTLPSSNVSTDIIMNVGSTNCNVGTVFGATAAGGWTNTTAFQSAYCSNQWARVCYLTNRPGVTQPHVDFKYVSGVNNRSYADCIRFRLGGCCCAGVPTPAIQGPVSTNSPWVTVTGVTGPSDLAVVVYQKVGLTETIIGQLLSGIVAGANNVPVTWDATSVGAQVVATQVDAAGTESCQNWPGYVVGGGPNPRLRVFLNCRTSPSCLNNGPVGAPSDSTGSPGLFFMPGTPGATTPGGGILVYPRTNWQTIVIDPRTVAKSYIWSGTGAGTQLGPWDCVAKWCGLEGIDFQMDDTTDTGPFDILIDNVYSGPDLLGNFETDWAGGAYTVGQYAVFFHPAYAGFPAGQFAGPESFFVVSNSYALSGTRVGEWKWQFSGGISSLWARNLMANGANWSYPQIHMDAPIQFDLLLLPKGQTVAYGVGTAPPMADQTNCPGTPFTVAVNVTPPVDTTTGLPLPRNYTYQWKFNDASISGATGSSYTRNAVQDTDAGTYSVVIGDGSGNTLTRYMILTVLAPVVIDTQPVGPGYPVPLGFTWTFSLGASVPAACFCGNTPALTYQWRQGGANIEGATNTAYTVGSMQYTDVGVYTALVSNTCNGGTVLSSNALLDVIHPVPPPWCDTPGLLGFYWTNQTWAAPFTGDPVWSNIDATVEFDWGTNSPLPGPWNTATDNFVIRWVGQVLPYYNVSQTYTFYTKSDDGVRLWVDGKLLINKWQNEAASEWRGSINLNGSPVDLILEYFEHVGFASVSLSWESQSVIKEIVPQSQLCAVDPVCCNPPFVSLTSPANNFFATWPNPVTLTATVTPQSAAVNKVEFYNNDTNLLAIATNSPYTQIWYPPLASTYNITARCYYNTTHTLNTAANKLFFIPCPPSPASIRIVGTNLTYGGGCGTCFVLLKSTNLAAPMSSWSRIATNSATPGSFPVPVGSEDAAFYRIQSE